MFQPLQPDTPRPKCYMALTVATTGLPATVKDPLGMSQPSSARQNASALDTELHLKGLALTAIDLVASTWH